MEGSDPIALLFGGLGKLGPGNDADTRHVLRLLPKRRVSVVVDAGCGTGRQTLVLARELGTPIHAVDNYEPFLEDLRRRATEAGLSSFIKTHPLDMQEIPTVFRGIDLLWSEGAAYNIGFSNALVTWGTALESGAFAVVSELSWLKESPPAEVREFFLSGYPAMRSLEENVELATSAGYRLLTTHTLPREAWTEGYYDILEPRAKALLNHPEAPVREFAAETIREIEVFERSEESYGYVFYVLERV